MKTDVEKLDPTRVRLSVEVPFDELKASLDGAYKQIGRQVRVPGFRPGKVPQRVIDARVGRAAVLEQAVNEALPRLYGAAVEEAGVEAIGQPQVDITQSDDGTLLTFTAEVDVRPEFELPSRDSIEVVVDSVDVDDAAVDAQIDEQIDSLRERFATATTVERAVADDDLVTLDLLAVGADGEPLEGGEVSGQTYKAGSGTMLDGLDDAIRGKQVGESATFTTTLVGTAEGEEATVTATVTAVKEQQLPELDDEFAQLASQFDTVDELRSDFRERLGRVRRREQLVGARDKVLETYLDTVDVPVPARLLEHELEHRGTDIQRELDQYGLTKEQYVTTLGLTVEDFDADNEKRARTAIKAQFVLDAIANADGLSVDEGELSQQIVNRAARAGVSPDQFAQQIVQSGQVQTLVSEVVRSKALAALVRAAVVTDTDGKTLDVEALEAEVAGPRPGAGMTVPADADMGQVDVAQDPLVEDDAADDAEDAAGAGASGSAADEHDAQSEDDAAAEPGSR